MAVQILDGKMVRDKILSDLTEEISRLSPKPKLIIIQVGDLPESNTYIGQKIKFGEKIGATVKLEKLPEIISQAELTGHINAYNLDDNTHGIIVQLPIPDKFDKDEIIESIDPKKDVDGLTATNIKLLFEGPSSRHPTPSSRHPEQSEGSKDSSVAAFPQNDTSIYSDSQDISSKVGSDSFEVKAFSGFVPATTKGVITILNHYKIPIAGKHVVIVGRSSLVGKPTALAFLNRDATVTISHSKSENINQITKSADILIVAAGKPKLITKNYVSKNQIVVDVGINVIDGKLIGDVDFDEVSKIVAAISPVPGGVGPMTVASLFQNLLQAYKNQNA